MKRFLLISTFVLSVFSCFAQMNGSKPVVPDRPSYMIVAFGTSLTEALQVPQNEQWTNVLQAMLQQRHPDLEIKVINSGISGSTTRERLSRLEKSVLGLHPDLVITDFATNDATFEPKRHVNLDEFASNIKSMHDRIVSKTGAAEIYWPQTPMLSEKHAYRDQPVYKNAGGVDKYVVPYRKITAKVSRKLRVPFVNMDAIFRKKFKDKGAEYYLCPDGVHFLKSGNQLVADSLLPAVEKVILKKGKPVDQDAKARR
ncbi:MAG: GDSL-type esterase/lipase family protein [Prolixibacteraceae bacterium]|jgi:lysophospholipase L1-like esterase|nr:GDSL-type esterase/lipase family protein [Prolixibacteraceae bacterium]